jgi:hypothetical protein
MIVSRDTQGHTTLFHARMPEAFKDRRLWCLCTCFTSFYNFLGTLSW